MKVIELCFPCTLRVNIWSYPDSYIKCIKIIFLRNLRVNIRSHLFDEDFQSVNIILGKVYYLDSKENILENEHRSL